MKLIHTRDWRDLRPGCIAWFFRPFSRNLVLTGLDLDRPLAFARVLEVHRGRRGVVAVTVAGMAGAAPEVIHPADRPGPAAGAWDLFGVIGGTP